MVLGYAVEGPNYQLENGSLYMFYGKRNLVF